MCNKFILTTPLNTNVAFKYHNPLSSHTIDFYNTIFETKQENYIVLVIQNCWYGQNMKQNTCKLFIQLFIVTINSDKL